jgi:PST family polysaccharide transporter
MYYVVKISPREMFSNIWPSLLAAIVMGVVGWLMIPLVNAIWWQLFVVVICILVYTLVITRFKTEKQTLLSFVKQLKK